MVDVKALKDYFENEVKVWDHPSMAVGIIKDGEVIDKVVGAVSKTVLDEKFKALL